MSAMGWLAQLLLFAAVVLFVWSLRDVLKSYVTKREARAETLRRRLYLDRPPALTIYGQPLLALATLLLVGFGASWVLGVLFGALVYFVVGLLPGMALRKSALAFEAQLPDALQDMANSTKAGLTLPQAVETVVRSGQKPIAQEFDQVLRDYRRGRTIEQSFDDSRERMQSRNYDLAIRAFRVGVQRGGNIAEVFEQIAGSIREIWRLEEHIKSVTSQGRSSARYMLAMPFVFFFLGFFMDPAGMKLMLSDPVGLTILSIVVLIMLVGYMAVNRIVNVDV